MRAVITLQSTVPFTIRRQRRRRVALAALVAALFVAPALVVLAW